MSYQGKPLITLVKLDGDANSLVFKALGIDEVNFKEEIMDEKLQKKAEKLVEEMKRVLKPGGTLILTTPHDTFLWHIIWWVWTRIIPYDEHKSFSKQQISTLLDSNGMITTHLGTTHFGCLILSASRKVK